MMEECLRGRCLVSHAEDGAQALEMLTHRSRRFDALVVDFEMPDLTGAALLELLHARGIYLPALMVSGMPAASHRAREVQAEFISKPFDLDQFETKVDQLLHASRGRRHCT